MALEIFSPRRGKKRLGPGEVQPLDDFLFWVGIEYVRQGGGCGLNAPVSLIDNIYPLPIGGIGLLPTVISKAGARNFSYLRSSAEKV